jgi:hypothetical protein
MANGRRDRQPNRSLVKFLCCGRAANAPAIFATGVLRNLGGFLGWTSRETLSNGFRKIFYESLIEFSLSRCSSFRFPAALFRVGQTLFLSPVDSFSFN